MPTKTLDVSALGDVNPYVVTAGYVYAAGTMRIISGGLGQASGTDAIIKDQTALTGTSVKSTVKLVNVSSDSRGCGLLDASGNGYVFLINSTNKRLFAVTANVVQTGSVLLTITGSPSNGDDCTMVYNTSTGVVSFERNGTPEGGTYAGSVYATVYACGFSRAANGRFSALTSEYTAAQTITSINGGDTITVGQTSVVIEHTGFTGAADTVTTNRAGVTATITAGDASSTTVDVSGWDEGEPYPVTDIDVTFTVSRSGESASGDQDLTRPANYDQVTFSGAITDDPNLIGYHLAAEGHTVEGGTFYYRNDQVATLTVLPDTDWTSDPAGGTFSAVFIPVSGATAGNAYLFDITINNGSIVVVIGGLSVRGLSVRAPSAIGLSVRGL